MFLSGNKQQTVKICNQSVDLKETKDLYGRLMVLAKSNRDIDKKSAAGNFEFTLTPRALFAPDGSILPCAGKSKLIHCLEKLDKNNETDQNAQLLSSEDHVEAIDEPETSIAASPKIVLVDGMVLVQQMTKNPSGVLELGWSSSLLILTSWFWLLRTMTKEHSHIDGLGCCGDLTNFGCTWRREGSSITCISCIHWCRHCWKILRTWQNEVVSTVHEG